MQKMQSFIVASVMLIVFAVQQGEAIKCYQCNSHEESTCADEIPSTSYIKNCDTEVIPKTVDNVTHPYTYCRKIYQIIEFSVNGCEAIKCYVCNSHSDSSCADEVPPVGLVKDCSDIAPSQKHDSKKAYTYCRKIFQIIEFSVNNLPPDSRVIRSCGSQNQTKTNYCYQRAGFGGRQVVCSCDQDECNAAGSLQINKTIMGTILFALLLFVKLV